MSKIRKDAEQVLEDYSEENLNPVAVRMRKQAKRVLILLDALEEIERMEREDYPDVETWDMAEIAEDAIKQAEEL